MNPPSKYLFNFNLISQYKVNIEKGKDRETKLNVIKEKYKNGDYDYSKNEIMK